MSEHQTKSVDDFEPVESGYWGKAMAVMPTEAETFWTGFLCSLANRGLRGVKLVISDGPGFGLDRGNKGTG